MLVSQMQEVRRFLGRLDPGQDLIAGLRTVCRENGVQTGWVQAWGLVRNPLVSCAGPEGRDLLAPEVREGVFLVPGLAGSIALCNDEVDLRLAGAGTPVSGGDPWTGVVRGGEVLHAEFWLMAGDDVVLFRDDEDQTGLGPFVTAMPGRPAPSSSLRPAAVPLREPPPAPATPASPSHPAPTVTPPPLRKPPEEVDNSDLYVLEMEVGDYIEHPRFGKCRILAAHEDDKVTIRLDNGKHVDLSLSVLRVLPPKMQGSRKVFPVELRRKS
ncbi:DNA-binding protein [Myxococcota bacterium]|mgnify:CR=1 FL=1|nr:DNA-binding protein [Myxococcota bacterium]